MLLKIGKSRLFLDRMKDAIIAKVAAQCEDLYAEALKQMQKETVRTLWDKVVLLSYYHSSPQYSSLFLTFSFFYKDWLPLVAGKQAAYHGLAEYHQSLVAKSQKNVGEELARLTVN